MSNNKVSQIISLRVDRNALAVLNWHASLTGVPMRTMLRKFMEGRAEDITAEFNLDPANLAAASTPVPPPPTEDETHEPLPPAPPGPRLDEFTARLAQATGHDAATLAASAVADADGTIYVTINGIEFSDTPPTPEPPEAHP